MDIASYLINYFLLNIYYHPINVFLLFTAVTTIISFIFIYVGKFIYKKFKKQNNFTLFLTTATCALAWMIIMEIYTSITGNNFSFNLTGWLFESIFIYFIIKIVKWVDEKTIKNYNLPTSLEKLVWALIGSAISWFLIIILFYINYILIM